MKKTKQKMRIGQQCGKSTLTTSQDLPLPNILVQSQ